MWRILTVNFRQLKFLLLHSFCISHTIMSVNPIKIALRVKKERELAETDNSN